ncbi:mannosyl-oligosaccharide 1,3-1,6-alpha-mannosidase activity protein, partial [Coemansia sp. RSA 1933]
PYLAQIDSRVAGQSAAAADPTAAAEKQLRLHRGDFYPYQDKPYEQYWSGMFTSRPVLKRLVRSAEQAVQHTEALVALARVRRSRTGMDNGAVWEALDRGLEFCRKQVAIGYHHDAVTGTCSRGAADDYEQRLNAAHRVAIRIGSFALQMAHANAVDPEPDAIERAVGEAKTGGPVPGVNTADDTRLAVAADGADTQAIVVTNANHMMAQDQTVRLLVPSLDLALVDPMTRRAVDAAAVARPAADGAGFEVDFAARSLPPLGWRSYVLANATTAARDYANVPLLRDAFRAPPPPASGRPATKAVLKRDGMHVHLNLDRHSGRVRIALGSHKVVHHQLRQYPVNPRVQPSGAYIMHSFILMYAIVFYVFGGGLCTGLAASVYLRSWRAKNNYQPARRAVRSPILATAMGAMGGLALVYYVEQVASIDTLDRWAGGSLTAPAGLAVFSFIVGYVVSVSLGARARLCVLFVYGVAAAIVMVLFGVPTWQSRPLALEPTGGFRLDVGGPVCDSATVDITADASVTYRLCTGRANMVEVTAHVRAAVDREVVAHFALNGGGAVPRVLRSCEFDMFDGVGVARRRYSRWTPVPGNYYPAVSHVALASGGLQLHSRQATGATCIAADTLEVGIHRSLSANDFRGLNDPLVDNTEATVTHYIDVGVDRMPGRSGVLANAAINAPALAFVLPLPDNANASLASYSGLGETSDAAVPSAVQNGCVRIVGIQSDESYQRPADDRLDIYARVQMLPGDARCLDKHGAEGVIDLPRLLAVAQHQRVDVFAAEPGDWSIGEWQRLRSEQKVERIRLQPGEQALFRFAIHPLGSEQIGS